MCNIYPCGRIGKCALVCDRMESNLRMLRTVAAPSRAKRRLGIFLANLRDREDISPVDAAAELKTSKSTLLRYEAGNVEPVWSTVQALLRLYRASDSEWQEGERLWQEAHDEPRPVRLPVGTPSSFRKLVTAEQEADEELIVAPYVVHGLLQTDEYTRALMSASHRFRDPGAKIDNVVSSRQARQERLQGPNALKLHVLLDQVVIQRRVGGTEVMRGQLEHLLTMAEWPNVTLQVIPFDLGAYGTMAGGCTIVTYPEPSESPNVYLEYPAGGFWVENVEDVQRFVNMFRDVTEVALSAEDTAKLINDRIRTLQ